MLLKKSIFLKFFLAILTLYFVFQLVIILDYSHPYYPGGPMWMERRGYFWADIFRLLNPVFIFTLFISFIISVFHTFKSKKTLQNIGKNSSFKINLIWSFLLIVLAIFEVYYFTLPFTYVR